ncbi:MAG TPA: antibiotic biosynthesis monooxygenase [Acidimicrobiia bacterium]
MGQLQGIARFKFHDGALDEFKRIAARCMEIARTQDTGTLQYEIYFNADESECVVLERYRDSEALTQHAEHIGDLAERLFATGDVASVLLGEPSPEIRAAVVNGPVRLFTPYLSL